MGLGCQRNKSNASGQTSPLSFPIHGEEEYGEDKIRVNSIHPGAVDTVMINEAYSDDFLTQALGRIPLGRIGTSMDIAKGALFLASDDADYITGTELIIDGGIYAG